MYLLDKKKILVLAIGALIISILVNFPHLINLLYLTPPPEMNGGPMKPFHRPFPRFNEVEFISFQFIWYYIISFILLFITADEKHISDGKKEINQSIVVLAKVIIVVCIAFMIENIALRQLKPHFEFRFRPRFDAILFSRYLFMSIISFLTGLLIKMVDRKNMIQIENERLRSENLQIQYNALTNQMNPHFFFNSLNSLQYLLIEGEQQKSVIYISELSTVFRYILQSSKKELVPLSDELDFLRSYQYLLNIRFEDKIRFDINIHQEKKELMLPVLTLQPLVENAINHNGCSKTNPLILSISVEDNFLVVSNNLIPKIHKSKSSGIGLDNLNKRFLLLTSKEIQIFQSENNFRIILPLKYKESKI